MIPQRHTDIQLILCMIGTSVIANQKLCALYSTKNWEICASTPGPRRTTAYHGVPWRTTAYHGELRCTHANIHRITFTYTYMLRDSLEKITLRIQNVQICTLHFYRPTSLYTLTTDISRLMILKLPTQSINLPNHRPTSYAPHTQSPPYVPLNPTILIPPPLSSSLCRTSSSPLINRTHPSSTVFTLFASPWMLLLQTLFHLTLIIQSLLFLPLTTKPHILLIQTYLFYSYTIVNQTCPLSFIPLQPGVTSNTCSDFSLNHTTILLHNSGKHATFTPSAPSPQFPHTVWITFLPLPILFIHLPSCFIHRAHSLTITASYTFAAAALQFLPIQYVSSASPVHTHTHICVKVIFFPLISPGCSYILFAPHFQEYTYCICPHDFLKPPSTLLLTSHPYSTPFWYPFPKFYTPSTTGCILFCMYCHSLLLFSVLHLIPSSIPCCCSHFSTQAVHHLNIFHHHSSPFTFV